MYFVAGMSWCGSSAISSLYKSKTELIMYFVLSSINSILDTFEMYIFHDMNVIDATQNKKGAISLRLRSIKYNNTLHLSGSTVFVGIVRF